MNHTVWMVVVSQMAAVVHSIAIGTLHISQLLNLHNLLPRVSTFYLVVLMLPVSHHCHYGRSKPDGQLLGTCAWC